MTSAEWHRAWAAALGELELDVTQAEALLAAGRSHEPPATEPDRGGAWSPPPGLGPLPLDLRPRADAILTRQLAAAEEIARALASNRRQAAATARIETGRGPARPAYVDQSL
jgi:hypothetical protein